MKASRIIKPKGSLQAQQIKTPSSQWFSSSNKVQSSKELC